MNREELIGRLERESAKIRAQYGVRKLSLFGSIARGDHHGGSDADFLVEFDGPATFDSYMALKAFLEEAVGCPVDLVTTKGVRPALYRVLVREAIRVA